MASHSDAVWSQACSRHYFPLINLLVHHVELLTFEHTVTGSRTVYLCPPLYLRPWIKSCKEELQGLLRCLPVAEGPGCLW